MFKLNKPLAKFLNHGRNYLKLQFSYRFCGQKQDNYI